MSLANDLRATAIDVAAMAITQALTGNGGSAPERLARAAVEAATPYLLDAELVDQAVAAREPADPRTRRPRPVPSGLWKQAGGDEHRYLELMEQHGWLSLTTCRVDGSSVSR